MKNIRFTRHALLRCPQRGKNQEEVREAVQTGSRESAKEDRLICRKNFEYNADWQGTFYRIKQVAPVIVETDTEIVVITVYTFYL